MGDLPFGRILIVVGLVLAGLGVLLTLGAKIPGLGRLPGDIVIERGSFRLYLPLATSILLSLARVCVPCARPRGVWVCSRPPVAHCSQAQACRLQIEGGWRFRAS